MSGVDTQSAPNTQLRAASQRVAATGVNYSLGRSEVIYAGSVGVEAYPSPAMTQLPPVPPVSTSAKANRRRAAPKHGQVTTESSADLTLRYWGGPNMQWL